MPLFIVLFDRLIAMLHTLGNGRRVRGILLQILATSERDEYIVSPFPYADSIAELSERFGGLVDVDLDIGIAR